MPFSSILVSFGVYHLAVVIFIILPSPKSNGSCTDHFPYDFSQTINARLWSCRAQANISLADALYSLIRTVIGILILFLTPVFVTRVSFFEGSFCFIITTGSPFGNTIYARATAVSRYQPPLLRKSRIIPTAPDATSEFHDFTNSLVVCSPKVATSI